MTLQIKNGKGREFVALNSSFLVETQSHSALSSVLIVVPAVMNNSEEYILCQLLKCRIQVS
jgi:hypothetical protein